MDVAKLSAPPAPAAPRPLLTGLTAAEATLRAARGLANLDSRQERTDGEVIRANALTFFNVVLGSLIVALFAVGEFRDGLFVGLVVAANVAVATFQEIRATRTLRQLVALTAPRATVVRDGERTSILAEQVVQGDLLHLVPGDQVVADGPVVADSAEIDQSLLTGESESVRKGPGEELLSGSFCVAGECYYSAEKVAAEAYAFRLTAAARKLVHRETPLQQRFRRILRLLLTATALLAAALMISYNVESGLEGRGFAESIKATTVTVTTVVPEGLLLGMTVAFAVGAVRVSRARAIVQDINAVESLNYVDIVCLDKTGTITAKRLSLRELRWGGEEGGDAGWLAAFAQAASGESRTTGALAAATAGQLNAARAAGSVPFSPERRWSALRLDLEGRQRVFVLGAPETVLPLCEEAHGLDGAYSEAAKAGLRGLVFAETDRLPDYGVALAGLRALALVTLADELRPEVKAAFDTMATLGIQPKLISGDNPETVAALVRQLGIDLAGGAISGEQLEELEGPGFTEAVTANSVFGRVSPALKARIVKALQDAGHYVAMVGDGANDVQALRQADLAVAMASGTGVTRAVAGIVLLDDSFEAFIRATKEAQSVLGNSARLSKLFIAKSLYAYVLIVATSMLGLNFPFLPRHSSLTALLTLGIPALFISISRPPQDAGRDFTRAVLRFALPASLALATAAIIVHLLTDGLLDRPIEEARTLVSITIGITGLVFMVQVLGFEGASFRNPTRPALTLVLAGLLVAALLATLYVDWLRSFFDFSEVSAGDWAIVLPAVVGALAGQQLIERYWPAILGFLSAQPHGTQATRGRPV